MQSREERIRAKAHELWEAEGRPGDRAENHWAEAERLIDAEDSRRGAPGVGPSLDEFDHEAVIVLAGPMPSQARA